MKGNFKLGNFFNFLNPLKTFVKKAPRDPDDLYEESKVKVIPFFTTRNDFALILLRLVEVSPTHRACINSKADAIIGQGFTLQQGTGNRIILNQIAKDKDPTRNQIRSATDWLKTVNSEGDSFLDIGKKIAIEYEAFGNVFIEEVRGEASDGKFYNVYVHSAPKCLFEATKAGEDPEFLFISPDWSPEYTSKYPPSKIPVNVWQKIRGAERRIINLRAYSPTRDIYGLPPSVASLLSQELELEVPSHNLDRFYNDFLPRVFMQFFSEEGMTKEEEDKFYEDLVNTYTRRGGKYRGIFAQVVQSKLSEAKVEVLETDRKDGEFLGLTDKNEATIFKAHQWHPLLAGVPTPAGLGNSTLLQNVFNVYNSITVIPRQELLLAKLLNPIFQRAGQWLEQSFQDCSLSLSTPIPISFVGDLDVNKIIFVNEGRKALGLPPDPDEERGGRPISDTSAAPKVKPKEDPNNPTPDPNNPDPNDPSKQSS